MDVKTPFSKTISILCEGAEVVVDYKAFIWTTDKTGNPTLSPHSWLCKAECGTR